ncbi:MAG: hypothetical protein L0Y36_01235 [Planctomycetales bacterium]|nr:hypothetical protein [Planctomycetales bacterium]
MKDIVSPICPLANQCSFYQQSKSYMPAVSKPLRDEYCLADNSRCACRAILTQLGLEWVPLHMMPYQHEWAEQILTDIANSHVPLEAAAPAGVL